MEDLIVNKKSGVKYHAKALRASHNNIGIHDVIKTKCETQIILLHLYLQKNGDYQTVCFTRHKIMNPFLVQKEVYYEDLKHYNKHKRMVDD